jgi:hypothetical protein
MLHNGFQIVISMKVSGSRKLLVDLESILLVAMTWKTETITLVNSMITYLMQKEEWVGQMENFMMENGTKVQAFNWAVHGIIKCHFINRHFIKSDVSLNLTYPNLS